VHFNPIRQAATPSVINAKCGVPRQDCRQLLPHLNAQLLPQLRQLPPGVRVISVADRLADIMPDEQIVVATELGDFDVYLWKAETLRGN
jgi:hypothetical protein